MNVKVNTVKQLVDFIAAKEQRGNAYTPEEFNLLLSSANHQLFRERSGLPQQYRPGSYIPQMSYEVTDTIKDDLVDAYMEPTLSRTDDGFPVPSDYLKWSSMDIWKLYGCNDEELLGGIDLISDATWSFRALAPLTGPSNTRGIARRKPGYFEVLPEQVQMIKLRYLKYPTTPVWAYDVDSLDNVTYNETNSTDFDWREILTNDIVRFVLRDVGIHLRDPEIQNYARALINEGK